MNINHKFFCTKIALALLGFSPVFWNSNPAHAVTGSLNLNNENFTIEAGSGLVNAPGSSTINTTATPDGFGNHFSSSDGNTFLLLGGNNPNVTIPSTGGNTNTSAYSEIFTITNDNIASGSLNFTFDWAFQGDAAAVGNDSFEIFIADSGFNNFTSVFRQDSYGQGSSSTASADISGFTAGDYVFYVTLNERIGNGNSAAGFDLISVSASVPFEFSPSLGLLMMAGLFGGHAYLKRRKLVANVKLD